MLGRYLLTDQNRMRSVNDIMPMIGARFYTQLDAAQMRNDVIEEDLAKVKSAFKSCIQACISVYKSIKSILIIVQNIVHSWLRLHIFLLKLND